MLFMKAVAKAIIELACDSRYVDGTATKEVHNRARVEFNGVSASAAQRRNS